MKLKLEVLETDILVIGGGAAGCFAALTACRKIRCTSDNSRKSKYKKKWMFSCRS